MKRERSVEAIFPIAKGRRAGDAAVDALPMTATLAESVDAWENAYFSTVGTSPFRPRAGSK